MVARHRRRRSVSRLEALFPDMNGKSLLDVGAGSGTACCYAASLGAERVVALEPESPHGKVKLVGQLADNARRWPAIEVRHQTLQEYEDGEPFDVIYLGNSINHLDESAVINLHRDGAARQVYRGLLKKLHQLLVPGGRLIMSDCARSNLFGNLGLRHPFKPKIEWHKHQNPSLWAELLRDVGFANVTWKWIPPKALRWLPYNRVTAYVTNSYFTLNARR